MNDPIVGLVPKAGPCGVCGETTLVTHQCQITGIKMGKCCRGAMNWASEFLEQSIRQFGMCHPPKESWKR